MASWSLVRYFWVALFLSVCEFSEGFLDERVHSKRVWRTTLFRAAYGWWYYGAPIIAKWKFAYNANQPLIPRLSEFKCIHLRAQCRERTSIFEPTPPTQPAQKVEFPTVTPCQTNCPRNHQKIGDFIVTSHSLGSGSFATVHLAMDRRRCQQVACKIIKAKNGKEISNLMKEVDILTAVQHVWNFDISIDLRWDVSGSA